MIPGRRTCRGVLAAAVCVAALAALAGCSDSSSSRPDRPDAGERATRRGRTPAAGDTGSLVTPLQGDSLVGAARGAGGVASLRWECASCHQSAHDVDLGRGAGVSSTCVACHATSHESIQAFYAGAVSGTSVPADTMFVSRVACAGCHTDATFATPAGSARLAELDAQCTSCHGTRFAGMLAQWRGGLAWRAQVAAGYVNQAAANGRLASGDARQRVRHARDAMELLRAAGPLHNVLGADRLFRAAIDSTASAYRLAGLAAPVRPALGPDPRGEACLSCHYGVEQARGTAFGERFDHAAHIVRGRIRCAECHSDAMYFTDVRESGPNVDRDLDPRHGRTTLTAAACAECHHGPEQSSTACASCHQPAELGGVHPTPTAMRVTATARRQRDLPFRHAQHGGLQCSSCHEPPTMAATANCASCHTQHHQLTATCTSCHTGAKGVHTREAHLGCAGCHEVAKVASLRPVRPVCLSCHVDMVNHNPGRECAQCHQVAWRPGAPAARSE